MTSSKATKKTAPARAPVPKQSTPPSEGSPPSEMGAEDESAGDASRSKDKLAPSKRSAG